MMLIDDNQFLSTIRWQSFGSSMTINAYYAHTKNMVHLTMGILDALGLNQNQPM